MQDLPESPDAAQRLGSFARPLRLGILQVNHDKSSVVGDRFPDDAHRFRDQFDAQPERFRYRVYMTIGGELPAQLDAEDAFLITGSPLSVLDPLPWLPALHGFIRQCAAAQKPLIGVCFGHQAIAQALGGQVARRGDWNVGVDRCTFDARPGWLLESPQQLDLYAFHHDEVTALPPKAEGWSRSARCASAGFTVGRHLLTTQMHPEITPQFMRAVLGQAQAALGTAYAPALAQLSIPTEGARFARWVSDFLIRSHVQDAA